MERSFLVILLCLSVFVSCDTNQEGSTGQRKVENALTKEEQENGWKLLFDGKTFDGWRGLGRENVPAEHWKIEEGTIRKLNSGLVPSLPDGQPVEGGDLMTIKTYNNYELYFEWKILKAGNTGLKYNVSEAFSKFILYRVSPE